MPSPRTPDVAVILHIDNKAPIWSIMRYRPEVGEWIWYKELYVKVIAIDFTNGYINIYLQNNKEPKMINVKPEIRMQEGKRTCMLRDLAFGGTFKRPNGDTIYQTTDYKIFDNKVLCINLASGRCFDEPLSLEIVPLKVAVTIIGIP